VANRVVDLLRDDPTMGPIELHSELKKKYKFEVPYDMVFRGKENALGISSITYLSSGASVIPSW
jgi:hypothetical protein